MKFDSSKSSTFVDGGRTSSITFATGVGVDPVIGANYKLTLRSGRDTVSVGGLSATGISLFLITDQTPKFDIDPFSGIQGRYDTYFLCKISLSTYSRNGCHCRGNFCCPNQPRVALSVMSYRSIPPISHAHTEHSPV